MRVPPCNAVFGVPLDGAGEDTAFDILALFCMVAEYHVVLSAINVHVRRIYTDGELAREATIRRYRIVQI